MEQRNLWNELVKVKETHPQEEVRKKAELLLRQYNTAGGSTIMRPEVTIFLDELSVEKHPNQ